MKRSVFLSLIVFLAMTIFAACAGKTSQKDIARWVKGAGIDPGASSLVIVRLSDNAQWISNPDRSAVRFPPASTSKIPHTLIALETGFATAKSEFKWDGTERQFTMWNQDQTLASAYARSAVWVYQSITSSLGRETMTGWIKKFGYGNMDIGSPSDLTTYWLTGPLEISAYEQIDFLRKLVQDELPLSDETMTEARQIMLSDTGPGWKMFSKTGWYMNDHTMDIGWFVGWLEVENIDREVVDTYLFALNMDLESDEDRSKRKSAVYQAFARLNIMK